ncbi:hypothetical protein GCM10009127_16930 [Alteraurantiacibacter aestuarii]|uniref:Uncharacterized protein n=1 Tax=Alteraurantiacibacter aestuarii TaxID=650004 RepID=A0A844ZGU7_9SPHN|nr:hypothetical protein [Alteraurantiacibacter aestuarii]MXO87721.1 hypothetical protein [Alteraurantiacibacter aestuarii]
MNKRLAFLLVAPVLLLPALAAEAPLRAQSAEVNLSAQPERQRPELGLQGIATPPLRVLQNARHTDDLEQMRIRQRVIIRISPSTPDTRERMLATLPRRASQDAFEEVAHDDCVEIDDIAGVTATQDNRLLLFMRNRHVLAAALEDSCTARAFYSGFYVERSDDGRLCIGRDRLQSRAGASCEVAGLTRIVAAGD